MPEAAKLLTLNHVVRPAQGDGPHAGLLLLHGFGADEYDLFGLTPALDRSLFVVSARAPYSLDYGGYAWHGIQMSGPPDNPTVTVDLATFHQGRVLLEKFVDEMLEAYPIDPDRLFVLGFSQGAASAALLTIARPERIAGAILMSTYLRPDVVEDLDLSGLAGKPILMIHGTEDPMISIENGRAGRDLLAATGADFTYTEYPMGHEIQPAALRQVTAWLDKQLSR